MNNTTIQKEINLTGIPMEKWRTDYIGNGYRSCCYNTVSEIIKGERRQVGQIILFGYDKNDVPTKFICPWKSHIKFNVNFPTKEKDIYGKYVETKYYLSARERKEDVDSNDLINIIECLPPENEFLHEMFDDVALDENFNKQPLRIQYIDIETEISESFEYPKTARNRINMLTIYDTKTEKYYTWSLQHCHKNFDDEYDEKGNLINESPIKHLPKDKFVIFEFDKNKCGLSNETLALANDTSNTSDEAEKMRKLVEHMCNNDEREMLTHFVNWFSSNYPDVLMSHNGQAYDYPYIVNRIERVLGDAKNVDDYDITTRHTLSNITKRLSPVGQVRIKKNNTDNERANKQAEIVAEISGIFLADELILYRDKFKINQPLDGGNNLDNIGSVELGAHKIHYKGTLKELYENNWDKFYFYNVIDVDLLKRVEEKVKTIPLSRIITTAGLSNYDAIYSSIGYLIGSLIMFAKTQLKTVFTSFKREKPQKIPYEGAYVFPPTPGLYTGGVACVDFNSLYPNSIIASNVSPETYVGKISRFPIEDPTLDFFAKEPPIDIYDTDTTKVLKRTDDEFNYNKKYGNKYSKDLKDCDIKKFYFLPANGSGQKIITREQLLKLLETKCIFTRNNTLFYKHSVKQGVVSAWSEYFYKLRKTTKKKGQKLEYDLEKGLITENIESVKELIHYLDNAQQARKIALNSIYGCLSTPFSPIYNPYIAQTITRTGKFCNQSASEYIRKCFKERFGIDDSYVNVTSGDTDSSFRQMSINIKR